VHELSVISQIIQTILDEAEKLNAIEVMEVSLDVGELTFLGLEQLKFGFEVLTKETKLKDTKLVIEKMDARIECGCGHAGPVEYGETPLYHQRFPLIFCPKCNKVPRIVSGKECVIRNIKMEVPDVQVQG